MCKMNAMLHQQRKSSSDPSPWCAGDLVASGACLDLALPTKMLKYQSTGFCHIQSDFPYERLCSQYRQINNIAGSSIPPRLQLQGLSGTHHASSPFLGLCFL